MRGVPLAFVAFFTGIDFYRRSVSTIYVMSTTRAKKSFNVASDLRLRRLALGFTAEQVARASAMSTAKISRIERNPARARHGEVLSIQSLLTKLAAEQDTAAGRA